MPFPFFTSRSIPVFLLKLKEMPLAVVVNKESISLMATGAAPSFLTMAKASFLGSVIGKLQVYSSFPCISVALIYNTS
ncbi:hypothetical protein D3C86_910980 [compost metagenome]